MERIHYLDSITEPAQNLFCRKCWIGVPFHFQGYARFKIVVEMTKSFFALFFHLFYVGNGNHIDLSSSPYAEDDVEFNSVRIEEQEIDFISLLRIYQQYDKEQRKENY